LLWRAAVDGFYKYSTGNVPSFLKPTKHLLTVFASFVKAVIRGVA
jgi:hypothetical protein